MKFISNEQISQKNSLKTLQVVSLQFSTVKPPDFAYTESLCFVSTPAQFKLAHEKGARGFIVLEKIVNELNPLPTDSAFWSTTQINYAMSEVLSLFDPKTETRVIHPSAVIHPTAKIGLNVTVGPNSVIEEGAVIGDHTYIAGLVYIGAYCEIGSHCLIGPNCTIGADGFGYYTDRTNQHHKIAQIGIVKIEDHCEFGANCAVDRATLTTTHIHKGCKFDNFCHVAHNCEIGENGIFAAGFMVAGSTTIGKNVTAGGGTHITGHVKICDNVVLGGRTGVISDITKPGMYSGFPQTSHKENLRIMMSQAHLPKMRKQLKIVLNKLGISDSTEGE